MIRLIAMDMDGTLLDPRWPKIIPPENAQVLRAAADEGVALAISSGRTGEDCSFFASDAGLPMHILALNGALCLDAPHGAAVTCDFLPRAAVEALLRLTAGTGLRSSWFGAEDLVLSFPQDPGMIMGDHLERRGAKGTVTYCMEGFERLADRGICKLVLNGRGGQAALAPMRQAIEQGIPGVEVTSSWVDNLEIMPKGVSKGSAVQALAARLGIPLEDVMTIGDNDNDMAMLCLPCCSVAMPKSTQGAVAAAKHHLVETDGCGVAAAVREFVLKERAQA